MPFFIPSRIADNITLSLTVIAGALVIRWVGEWLAVRKNDPVVARQRRFTIRAVLNAVLALALLGIWMSEVQNVVFSLAAVMVALVVATKELIMCVAGAALRIGGHLFKVGDRIEMNGIHGEVIDHGLFSTTIMELPPHHLGYAGTGRRVMLPNSILLTGPVRVEAQPRQFAPHRFTLTMDGACDVRAAVAAIERIAGEVLTGDEERAARFHRMTGVKAGTEIAGPGHEVTVGTSEIGKLQFHVMIYCLVRDARALEQRIILGFFEEVGRSVSRANRSGEAKSGEERAWAEITRQLREPPRARENAA